MIGLLLALWVVLLIITLIVARLIAQIGPLIPAVVLTLIVPLVAPRLVAIRTLRVAILTGPRPLFFLLFIVAEIHVVVGEVAVRFRPFIPAGLRGRIRLDRQWHMRGFLLARFLPLIHRFLAAIQIEFFFQRFGLSATALVRLRTTIAPLIISTRP